MKKYGFLIIIISYFILNILNTYFLTVEALNKYIVSFETSFLSELFAIVGNFSVLGILLLLGVLILKRPKKMCIYMIVLTLLLNIAIIALQYVNKGYKMAFSLFNFTLFKNPAGGFGGNVFLDWMVELFIYYRILCILPFLILLTVYQICKKKIYNEKIEINFKKAFIGGISLILFQSGSYAFYQYSLEDNWGYSTEYAQFGVQYAGAYNYYLTEFIFQIDNRIVHDLKPALEYQKELDEYNTNKNEYVNFIDGKTYSNKDKQTGILKDKNIFVIQMESTMSFVFNQEFNGVEITPYFNEMFKDENCFYFSNAYTNVGIGNTSDAEVSFFTGMFPTGDMTIAWEYADYDFEMNNILKYLPEYNSYSYNGTDEIFYNHNNFHEGLFNITNFRGLDTFERENPRKSNADKYLEYWISDKSILNWAKDTANQDIKNNTNVFSFVETITPHNPFNDNSKALGFETYDYKLDTFHYQLTNYLNQVKFNDKQLYDFIMDTSNPESPNYMEDTVYILYGDHGNALSKPMYEDLYGRKLSNLEYHQLLLNVPIIFYDPTGEIHKSLEGEDIDSILSSTKSCTNMYRTILNLLGVETTDQYYSVNIFSGEPSFSYDPKNFTIITDDFTYCKKNNNYILHNGDKLNYDILNKILKYRSIQDNYLNSLIYNSPKR